MADPEPRSRTVGSGSWTTVHGSDSDSSHDMAYVDYSSDNKRKDSEVSQEELTYLAQLHQEDGEISSDDEN